MTAKKKRSNTRKHSKGQKGRNASTSRKSIQRCGLCGKAGKLTQTECCGQWICDDEDTYVMFSYARNSCYRDHQRYTLCGYHYAEEHTGDWRECQACQEGFETEMYVYYGTNEYNFVKLENPPSFEPTHCKQCGTVINLGEDGYSMMGKDYYCSTCTPFQ